MTLIPANLQFLMASMTSDLGGSNIPTTPTKVQFAWELNFLITIFVQQQ